MKYQLAPLEGITTYIFRNAYNKYYGAIDEFFTPFISSHKDKTLNSKEINEIKPENNKDIILIPQVLTNNAEDYLKTEREISEFGYSHININFGCPSGTVTSKFKGSGIFKDLEMLDRFLFDVFDKTNMKISIKTRIGYSSYDECGKIIDIYKKYPISELIVHPRIREDYYKNEPNYDVFEQIVNAYPGNISFNGNVFSKNRADEIEKMYPSIVGIMIGRGMIANPGMLNDDRLSREEELKKFQKFHDEIYYGYHDTQSGEKNVLFRMKELWFYFAKCFETNPKMEKAIKKATNCSEYEIAVNYIIKNAPLIEDKNKIVF